MMGGVVVDLDLDVPAFLFSDNSQYPFLNTSCRCKLNTTNKCFYSAPVCHRVLIQRRWIVESLALVMKQLVCAFFMR